MRSPSSDTGRQLIQPLGLRRSSPPAFSLLAGALELDQVRTTGLLLAELEPAAGNLEIDIALR